jgi:electron transport complex protein RnfG
MGRGVLEPSYRKRIGYQTMLLGGMATLVSALLVLGDMRTRDDIAERHAEDLRASLGQVLPASYHDNDLLADTLTVTGPEQQGERVIYIARQAGKVAAVAFETSGQGYAGEIASIMAVDKEGNILGVRILRHAETPGLGDKIEVARSNWVRAFDGHNLDNPDHSGWKVKKDGGIFDQFTGATITPRAVVRSVYEGLQFFADHRQQILTTPLPAGDNAAEKPHE